MHSTNHHTQIRRRFLKTSAQYLLSGTATGLGATSVMAQGNPAWPSRPVRIIVPFPPGGTTDYVTRLIAGELSKSLGVAVVVENKAGAGTVIGVDAAAKATPDGYTFVCVANSFCVNHSLVKKLPYDTLKDLRPVALMGMSEHVLASHPGNGLVKLSDLAAQARAKPAGLSYASFGQGTSAHLAGEMLRSQLGIDLVHVPYKGQAPALSDLLAGQVSMMFGNWPEFRGHIQSGKLVALGMATAKRSPYAPQVPTLAEQGVPVESNSWNGLLTAAATPDAIVTRMNAEVNKALSSASVTEAFQKGGITSLAGSPPRFGDFIQTEIKRYAEVIQRAKIVAEG